MPWNRFLLLLVLTAGNFAQTPAIKTSARDRALDAEASKIVSAAQDQLKKLPADQKLRLSDTLRDAPEQLLQITGKQATFDELVSTNPGKLTLVEKNKFLVGLQLRQQTQQQLVDPSLMPSAASGAAIDAVVAAYKTSRPLEPAEIAKVTQSLTGLPAAAKSIGRLLWSDPAQPAWHLGGTVFVTRTNEIATACHVISEIAGVSSGQLILRNDRSAVIDFSEAPVPISGPLPAGLKTYPVVKLLAAGSEKGCDVAVLQIAGAEAITHLRLRNSTAPPGRMLVVGYPQLDDLNPAVCQFAIDPTAIFFCSFMTAHPGTRKVASPGNFYTSNVHDGIGVFTYSANTRQGQSGSPVLDLDTLQVAGVHYCCTGSMTTTYTLGCATWHPQNLRWNEAINTKTILADKALKDHFEVAPAIQ